LIEGRTIIDAGCGDNPALLIGRSGQLLQSVFGFGGQFA
jgi:hypothetical protein